MRLTAALLLAAVSGTFSTPVEVNNNIARQITSDSSGEVVTVSVPFTSTFDGEPTTVVVSSVVPTTIGTIVSSLVPDTIITSVIPATTITSLIAPTIVTRVVPPITITSNVSFIPTTVANAASGPAFPTTFRAPSGKITSVVSPAYGSASSSVVTVTVTQTDCPTITTITISGGTTTTAGTPATVTNAAGTTVTASPVVSTIFNTA